MKLLWKIVVLLGSLILLGVIVLLMWYFIVTGEEKLSKSKLSLSLSTLQIYDCEEKLVKEISASGSVEKLPFEQFPHALYEAFIAVEDKHFFTHNGLEYPRILKAALKNLTSFSFREGASTISQQLIKNTHLSGEKTVNRKLKEIKLTRLLEKNYSKEQILELYLNSIYFGHSSFGVANAARFYFDKSVEQLSPAECATLAALVKSPNRYSPFLHAERCLTRRNFVLSLMREQGYLTEREYDEAVTSSLPLTPTKSEEKNGYLTLVLHELAQILPDFGSTDYNNLKIYTALDSRMQAILDAVTTESDRCLLVRNNQTNAVCAFSSTCGVVKRLPASTIKPLAVYAPAIEEGFLVPATPILDEAVNFSGYCPTNYGGGYSGYVSAREALSRSINVPAVKILNEIGCHRAKKYLSLLNMPVKEEDCTLALALGGMSEGYTLPALCDGYATFANDGEWTKSHTILRIENAKNRVIYRPREQNKRVFRHESTTLINDMLKTAVTDGTAKKLRSIPYEVCAKTGTGANDRGNTDAYTVAYTKNHVVGVWLGNADNSPINATGGGIPADIALSVLKNLYVSEQPLPFNASVNTQRISLDIFDYKHQHALTLADGLAPMQECFNELFITNQIPSKVSTRFSCPTIENPQISVQNGGILIELCQTEYYDYLIKRRYNGQEKVIYRGKYQKTIIDNSVDDGATYEYTVQPFYQNHAGNTVILPSVKVNKSKQNPDEWWE